MVTDGQFCTVAIRKDSVSCPGDSGGPVVLRESSMLGWRIREWVIGLISFGAPGCPAKDKPEVHVRVGFYLNWIKTVIESDNDKNSKNTKSSVPGKSIRINNKIHSNFGDNDPSISINDYTPLKITLMSAN